MGAIACWRNIPPVTYGVHPLVVAQVRHDRTACSMRLITELVHPVVQLYGVVSSVYPSERPGGYASTHVYSPVDDIASLYEEVNASRPVPVLVHDARHMQDLLRVWQVAMKVSDGHYSPCELPSNMRLSGVR